MHGDAFLYYLVRDSEPTASIHLDEARTIPRHGFLLGGTGFDGPLGPGNYTFWIQEGSDQIGYTIDFVVTPVPEPGSIGLLGAAAAAFFLRRRRKLQRKCAAGESGAEARTDP